MKNLRTLALVLVCFAIGMGFGMQSALASLSPPAFVVPTDTAANDLKITSNTQKGSLTTVLEVCGSKYDPSKKEDLVQDLMNIKGVTAVDILSDNQISITREQNFEVWDIEKKLQTIMKTYFKPDATKFTLYIYRGVSC